ncbi:phage holin family protein [Streptacidiphilus sp. N1-10]|uniref:Phage holin family protein n=1 Tax=Streptacidiphilus jeojiensis TaxID=3229225 RepID=A0ABV6XXI8_9ACTN
MSAADRYEASPTNGGADRTVGQLFAAATADLSALVHDEIALAKQEIKKDVFRGVSGGGAGAVAAVVALASIPMFSFAAAYGIHALGITLGWSFLIVAGAFVLIAAVLGLVAFRFFKKISPPERTIASTKATVDVLKGTKPHPAAPITADGHKVLTR